MTAIADCWSPCRIDKAKGNRRHRCSWQHAELVEGFRLAQEDQRRRAEAATHGYATELAGYFDPHDGVERRLTFKDWLTGSADRSREHWEAA